MDGMQGIAGDPWVLAQIEAAVRPYLGRLAEEEIEWMKERLRESLLEEAAGRDWVRRARPREAVEQSGEMAFEPFTEEELRGEGAGARVGPAGGAQSGGGKVVAFGRKVG